MHILLFFFISLLLVLFSYDGAKFRRLPEERDLVFQVTTTDPRACYYKANQEIEIPLRLTSKEEAAEGTTFHVLSATLDDGTDVRRYLAHDALSLQENIVRYTPQSPGEHHIRFRIGVTWEEEGVQEAMCRVAIPSANWRLEEEVKDTGELTITIRGAPEEWKTESWCILGEPQWSEGLTGKILLRDNSIWEDTPLQRGKNESQITLTKATLDAPHISFTVEGPDKVMKTCRVDLTQLCAEKLKGAISEAERVLATSLRKKVDAYVKEVDALFTQDAQGSYQLPPETATDPRKSREKGDKLTTLLGRLENYQREYEEKLRAFEAYLASLAQGETNTNVHRFRYDNKRLEAAIASLKSAQVQLQCQCTSAQEALFKKFREGEQEDTEILLEDPRLDVNARCRIINNGEETLLHAAVSVGNEVTVRKLLEKGADVNARQVTPGMEDGEAPLHLAINRGLERMVSVLLKAKDIDVNARSTDGATPLHAAAGKNNPEVVRLLLNAGAEVNNQHGQWASLSRVAKYSHFVSLLDQLRNGLMSVYANADHSEIRSRHILFNHGLQRLQINTLENGDGISPLHIGAASGNPEIIKLLLNRRADVNARNENGTLVSPLHLAALRGPVEAVNVLLDRGADINAQASSWTPLHVALWRDQVDVVRVLLNRRARVNPIKNQGTPNQIIKTIKDVFYIDHYPSCTHLARPGVHKTWTRNHVIVDKYLRLAGSTEDRDRL